MSGGALIMAWARAAKSHALLVAFVLALTGAASALAASQVVGIAAAIVKDVRIKGAGMAQSRPAALRQRIALGDQVQTGARSQLQALLLDRSAFTVGPDARLTIDRFVYDPAGGGSFTASLAKGALRFMSGRPGRDRSSTINTPVASIGIRGTVLDAIVGEEALAIARGEREIGEVVSDPQTATLVVLRGPGPRTSGRAAVGAISVTAAGKTVELDQPLLAAYVPGPGMAPIGPFTLSLPGLARLGAMIMPRQQPGLPGNVGAAYPPRPRPSGNIGVPLPPGVGPGPGGGQAPSSPGGWGPGGYGPGGIGPGGVPSFPPRPTGAGGTRPQPQDQQPPTGQNTPTGRQPSAQTPPPDAPATAAPPPAATAGSNQQPQPSTKTPLR